MENRFISIDYSEDTGAEYTAVTVSEIKAGTVMSFSSGDPVKDFGDMHDWCCDNPIAGWYMFTSSVDHFCFDVPGYKWIVDDGVELIARMTDEEAAQQRERRRKDAEEEAVAEAAERTEADPPQP